MRKPNREFIAIDACSPMVRIDKSPKGNNRQFHKVMRAPKFLHTLKRWHDTAQ